MSIAPAAPADARPGRTCPVAYRYSPRVFRREPDIVADTLYVVGGLYGNVEALLALDALAAAEPGPVTIVFNGDFHWFDVAPEDFRRVNAAVRRHAATRGNVETEIAAEDSGAGCGCAYPADVADADVTRSNEILHRLRATARCDPQARRWLAALPMHRVARVGRSARIGIVHGDAASLAGWGFAHDRLDDPRHDRWLESMFREAGVDAFASTHTCLPALRRFEWGDLQGVVANNGAAGMPNYAGTRHGSITRIGIAPLDSGSREAVTIAGVHVEPVALRYDHEAWTKRFLASWPPGSAAHESYARRIADGPSFPAPAAARPSRAA